MTFLTAMPMGQMPVLEHNGKRAHQSMALMRYLAKQVGLVGSDDWENLTIDAAADTVNDFRASELHFSSEMIENLIINPYRNRRCILRS
jgi:glutathione S-transferase